MPTGVSKLLTTSARLPAAIEPPHIKPRFASQASRFVTFSQTRDLTKIKAVGRKGCKLAKIMIQREARSRLLNELERMGITESTVFPDLAGLGAEICRRREKLGESDN